MTPECETLNLSTNTNKWLSGGSLPFISYKNLVQQSVEEFVGWVNEQEWMF